MTDSYFLGSEIELKHINGTVYEASGTLVYFGNGIKSADFVDDYFAVDTDYDLSADGTGEATVYFNHGVDAVIGKNKLGNQKAQLTKDDRAVWIKQHLDIANTYDAMVVELIEKRKSQTGKNFGWSSGGVSHLVEREAQADGSMKIVKWPLGADASITLIPADWRQTLIPAAELKPSNIKSLLDEVSGSDDEGVGSPEAQIAEGVEASQGAVNDADNSDADEQILLNSKKTEVIVMDETPEQNDVTDNKAISALEVKMAQNAENIENILKAMQNAPRDQIGGYYTDDGGSADPNIKTAGDLLLAVARKDIKRLTEVYNAKTQNTLEGAEGSFLIPESTLTDVGLDISLVSELTSRCRRIPVPTPSGNVPMRNYKVTPTGQGQSASASGVKSQKRKEGSAYAKEVMLLENLKYDVSDFASGYLKATRMQMKAAPMIEALIKEAVQEDVANREEYAVLRGSGNGEPLGILNWDGLQLVEEITDDTFVAADSDKMVARLLEKGNTNIAWAYHNSLYTSLAPMVRDNPAVAGNRGQAISTVFHGYHHFKSQHLPVIGSDGYIVLGDWNKYIIFEYEGLYINFSEHTFAQEGKVAWFFGKNIDGKPVLPEAITLADGTYDVSPFVAMQNKA